MHLMLVHPFDLEKSSFSIKSAREVLSIYQTFTWRLLANPLLCLHLHFCNFQPVYLIICISIRWGHPHFFPIYTMCPSMHFLHHYSPFLKPRWVVFFFSSSNSLSSSCSNPSMPSLLQATTQVLGSGQWDSTKATVTSGVLSTNRCPKISPL